MKELNKNWLAWFVGFVDAEGNTRKVNFSTIASREISTLINNNDKNDMNFQLDPLFVTGFCDAEASFSLGMSKNNRVKIGWVIKPIFNITLHEKDLDLLLKIQYFFCGIGSILRNKNYFQYSYSVASIKDFNETIIPHFTKYPLISKKRIDYELFKQAIDLINLKEHKVDIIKFINIRASINKGLTPILKSSFDNIIPVKKPDVNIIYDINPNWLAGFIEGEGCFYVNITRSKTKIGYAVNLNFTMDQHNRDEFLMEKIKNYLNCGTLIDCKDSCVRFSCVAHKN